MITGEKKLLRAWALFLPGGIRLPVLALWL